MRAPALVPVVEGTGEIVAPSNGGLSFQVLRSYAEARAKADVLRLQRQARIEQLTRDDPVLRALDAELAAAELHAAEVEAQLAEAFDDKARRRLAAPITVDAGFIRVTWPKPAVRWTQRVKPAVIARDDSELAERLGIRQETSMAPAPRITIRLDKVAQQETRKTGSWTTRKEKTHGSTH